MEGRLLKPETAVYKPGPRYKWVALSNTTLGSLMASINMSSLIIALPVIFRGIKLDPLAPSNFTYLLWVLIGYVLVTAVLVVTLGRIGDMFGRVKMYNLGFVVFTVGSVALSLTWSQGTAGALEIIILRMVQAVGGAMLMANSAAILTDAFPEDQRGLALGINQISAIAGQFLGLVLGAVLAEIDWRWVFLINVPIGVLGTVWAYLRLHELAVRSPARIDWTGNITFAAGLTMVLVGITYGIKPYGSSVMGWSDPFVIWMLVGGVALLVLFSLVELHVAQPMFNLGLFRIRAFTAGNLAQFLAAVGRGGLMFMLVIWFQGIWLPSHGYDFVSTPLWAGIYMLPLTLGFLVAGPVSGTLSDRYGARPFSTGGMLLAAASFVALIFVPANFSYPEMAAIIFFNGIGMGLFSSPNSAAIMNSVPARHRGAASGMRVTFRNAGMPLSIGVFFTLVAVGLAARLPGTMQSGLVAHGVPLAHASALAHEPPLSYLFAALLGYNPMQKLLGPGVLNSLPAHQAAILTSRTFFPELISPAFHHGLALSFLFAALMCVVAAIASALRGGKYHFVEPAVDTAVDKGAKENTKAQLSDEISKDEPGRAS